MRKEAHRSTRASLVDLTRFETTRAHPYQGESTDSTSRFKSFPDRRVGTRPAGLETPFRNCYRVRTPSSPMALQQQNRWECGCCRPVLTATDALAQDPGDNDHERRFHDHRLAASASGRSQTDRLGEGKGVSTDALVREALDNILAETPGRATSHLG
jgi:hypothetical protein